MHGAAGDQEVLIVTDPQCDFCPGGALAVPSGDAVMPAINRLARRFSHVIVTQDWHPPGHASFVTTHPGRQPFETIAVDYGEQTLWPEHCVQDTPGAAFHPALDIPHVELVIRKGYHRAIDSYSAFRENDRKTATGLAGYLRERGFERVTLCGLATDFCVFYSAIDAREAGFAVTVDLAASGAIDLDGSLARAFAAMREAGIALHD